jgi:plastocyanin
VTWQSGHVEDCAGGTAIQARGFQHIAPAGNERRTLAPRQRSHRCSYDRILVDCVFEAFKRVATTAALMAVLTACSATSTPSDHARATVTLRAADLKFDPDRLTVPPGVRWQLAFQNLDRDIPHDVAIYRGEVQLFRAPTTFGIITSTYDQAPLAAGPYLFRCDIHPLTMIGTLIAE